ncbi:hypothetical protein [Acinetobacter baumannii]|uniref:hypothetical protein n=1 Tax=Acinetobacter baumannii TaxID=470 RepID=UPI00044DBEEC|nr:hypothetical protein [Acinetobacter baumannii]EXE36317.1 hypothetical protein J573_3166 [Acinetobacter baumannii 1546444]
MKKFNEFELIGIGIALLLICIIFSIIGKHVFGLEGDYLSAAATLFAAVVAFLLYQDWREAEDHTTLREFILIILNYHKELSEWQISGVKYRHEIIRELNIESPNLNTTKATLAKMIEFDRVFVSYILNIHKNLSVIEKLTIENNVNFNIRGKMDKYYDKANKAYEDIYETIVNEENNYLNTIKKIELYGDVANDIVHDLYGKIIVELIEILPAKKLKGQ